MGLFSYHDQSFLSRGRFIRTGSLNFTKIHFIKTLFLKSTLFKKFVSTFLFRKVLNFSTSYSSLKKNPCSLFLVLFILLKYSQQEKVSLYFIKYIIYNYRLVQVIRAALPLLQYSVANKDPQDGAKRRNVLPDINLKSFYQPSAAVIHKFHKSFLNSHKQFMPTLLLEVN